MKSWINRAGVAGGVLCTLLAALLVVLGLPLVGRSRPSYVALATVTLLVFTIAPPPLAIMAFTSADTA